MTVLITNAYSAANAGDGLLVDLSIELLADAGHMPTDSQLIAVDPRSFDGRDVVPIAAPASAYLGRLHRSKEIATGLVGLKSRRLDRHFRDAEIRVAVGGGYLRFGTALESAKTMAVHMPQLAAAAGSTGPTVLLPQSIGPLGRHRRRVLRVLSGFEHVFVRDDRSAHELSSLGNVSRVPDLAVMSLGVRPVNPCPPKTGMIGLVLRDLPGRDGYKAEVAALLRRLGDRIVPLLQSQTGSGNRDLAFYQSFGLTPRTSLREAVATGLVDAVISVRLHGALQAILAGVPAVHLSYERKGFSAFNDLGIGSHVHNAGTFESAEVAAQATGLTEDPAGYWAPVRASQETIRAHRAHVVDLLGRLRS